MPVSRKPCAMGRSRYHIWIQQNKYEQNHTFFFLSSRVLSVRTIKIFEHFTACSLVKENCLHYIYCLISASQFLIIQWNVSIFLSRSLRQDYESNPITIEIVSDHRFHFAFSSLIAFTIRFVLDAYLQYQAPRQMNSISDPEATVFFYLSSTLTLQLTFQSVHVSFSVEWTLRQLKRLIGCYLVCAFE